MLGMTAPKRDLVDHAAMTDSRICAARGREIAQLRAADSNICTTVQ